MCSLPVVLPSMSSQSIIIVSNWRSLRNVHSFVFQIAREKSDDINWGSTRWMIQLLAHYLSVSRARINLDQGWRVEVFGYHGNELRIAFRKTPAFLQTMYCTEITWNERWNLDTTENVSCLCLGITTKMHSLINW